MDSSIDYSSGGVFSWIAQGFDNVIKAIVSIVDYLNPFSENFFLKDFFEFIAEALSYINPFDENFILLPLWDYFVELISYINPFSENFFVYKLIDLLGELLKFLFVPSEDSINNLVDSVKSHFRFVDTIKNTITVINDMFENTEALPKITITLKDNKWYSGQITVMDLSWYSPYKQFGDLIISAFIYVFFLWRIFINLPNIISGTGGGINDVSIASSDIEAYRRFGFGRRSTLTRTQR